MAGRTVTESTDGTVAEAPAKAAKYVVLSDALVVTIGKKANGQASYTRVLRGGVVNGSPDSEAIKGFLQQGVVMRVKNAEELAEVQADLHDPLHSRHRLTVRKAAARMGAADDPVQAPLEGVLPVPAPNPDLSPTVTE